MKQIAFLIMLLILGACSPTEDGVPVQSNATSKNQVSQNEVWISGWKETSPLNVVRAGAAMVTYNNFVYMIAGVDGRKFLRSTEYAPILPDGRIGEWKTGPQLIEDRGFTEAVVKNGYIYVVGGGNGPNGQNLLTTVERAKINPDGSLGAWRQENNRTVLPRRCTKLSLIGDYLYSFGGYGGALLDSVEYAKIETDGSVGKWTMASEAMTLPRYVNSVKTVDGFAFVLGGHDQQKGVGIVDVEWARPQVNGDMHSWQKTSPLKTGRYGVASAKNDKTIYMLGGLTGLEYLGSIEKSQVLPEGGLTEWQETTAMSVPRATFSAFTNNGYIYVLGGANRDGYLRSVEYAEINAQGDLGFMGSPQEREQYLQHVEDKKNNAPVLPNEGVVKQILNAEMYSYVQVLNQGKLAWIAGPKTEMSINSHIQYSKGVYMSNFFSKELQKTFPEVNFVSRIEVVE